MKAATVTFPAVTAQIARPATPANAFGTLPEAGLAEPNIEVEVDLSDFADEPTKLTLNLAQTWPEERPTIPVPRDEYLQRLSESGRYAVVVS